MFTKLLLVVLLGLLSFCLGSNAWARTHEIRFDGERHDKTTVIGLYTDNGLSYHEYVDFSLLQTQGLNAVTILMYVHVGSEIVPAKGHSTVKLGARVNGGIWHWLDLEPYRNDGSHWLEIETDPSEWKPGLNRVETHSTVGSVGNMTSRSLDLLASSNQSGICRSGFSMDLATYVPQQDRNWGIRLRLSQSQVPASKVDKIRVEPQESAVALNQPQQFIVVGYDKHGAQVALPAVKWSAKGGIIDEWGLFQANRQGIAEVRARSAGKTARATYQVVLVPPAGIEPPISTKRLGAQIPSGHESLCGTWDFSLDPADVGEREKWFNPRKKMTWGEIHVPGSWQAQGWDLFYHDIGWYRTAFTIPREWRRQEIWLRFGAAATHAKVWLNGHLVGEHLGNWTPFEFRVTDFLHPRGKNLLVVRVHELPNHLSAGFPRVLGQLGACDSHFGGLWQEVSLFATDGVHIEDVFVSPKLAEQRIQVEVSLTGKAHDSLILKSLVTDPEGHEVARVETPLDFSERDSKQWRSLDPMSLSIPIPNPLPWSPDNPALYVLGVEVCDASGRALTRNKTRFGMRDVCIEGSRLYLNGKPLYVRGVLHWGYYPDLFSIDPSEQQIRKEFEDFRAAGFNMVKVCLFLFPKRFYEIADEMGMLLWQEYPIWLTFPQKAQPNDYERFSREFSEWFRFDRNHPSVILRDLTCEAHEPDKELMKALYDLGKEMTDGAPLEDNSAYLNQVYTDWYDCHMYRELDHLYDYLPSLAQHMREQNPVKPYMSGEDLDEDTYRDCPSIRGAFIKGEQTPWWIANNNFRLQESFEKTLAENGLGHVPKELVRRQNLRAIAFRKACFEDFRRFSELNGYVMTSVRDTPPTRPGFYDDLLRPKWASDMWRQFNSDRVLFLHSPRRSRCFRADEDIHLELGLSNFGESLSAAPFRWRLSAGSRLLQENTGDFSTRPGTVSTMQSVAIALPSDLIKTQEPVCCRFEAQLGDDGALARNEWNLWLFPAVRNVAKAREVTFFEYVADGVNASEETLYGVDVVPVRWDGSSEKWIALDGSRNISDDNWEETVLITERLDGNITNALQQGARVLYLPNHDSPMDVPRQDAPFWREMAIWLPTGHPALGDFPHEDFVDLQFLDMTQRRPFVLGEDRHTVESLIWGTNTRHPGATLYDYVYEASVGNGRMIACCLNLRGTDNVAGDYLMRCLGEYLLSK